jgi:hypothetical protein
LLLFAVVVGRWSSAARAPLLDSGGAGWMVGGISCQIIQDWMLVHVSLYVFMFEFELTRLAPDIVELRQAKHRMRLEVPT